MLCAILIAGREMETSMKNELTAQRLSTALNRKGINQQQLADMSGVSKHSISQYIHGSHTPSNISATKIGTVLDVNPMWLMGYDVPMTDDQSHQYYINQKTAEIAQELFNNPDLRILFDAARDAKPENLRLAAEMLRSFKGGE
jgi:transcriptional regulator with XRE-family HTH domain